MIFVSYRAIRLTGPFVTMIFSMITGDMFTFGIIYVIVLFGFSQAFFFLYKGHPQIDSSMFQSYPSTWMALFQTTLGDYNYADLVNTTYPNLAKTVYIIFMIFVPILLLNMLIAMMGNTYAYVIEQSEKEWVKQWAKIVVTLERAVPQADAKKYLEDYSIPLGPAKDDSGLELRGVMVIKSKSKTRAKQRKGAVSNWKYVGKVTLTALKKRGMTGEELRRIMWGRASISSPTKISKKKRDPNDPFAIASALDGMSFAQDIVMLDDEAAHVSATGMGKGKGKSSVHPAAVNYKDPLRELVLISEKPPQPGDPNYHSNVKILAKEATTLDHVQEVKRDLPTNNATVPPTANTTTTPAPAPAKHATAKQLFLDPKETVNVEKEREFLKQLEALEESECEGFTERPVLGKISLIRRAKSAVNRSSVLAEQNEQDEHPLFKLAWDGNANTVAQTTPPGTAAGVHISGFEVDEDEAPPYEGHDDDGPVTMEEVRHQMEMFHVRPRNRNSETSATGPYPNRAMMAEECQPESKKKFSKQRRNGATAQARNK